eukprot:UN23352
MNFSCVTFKPGEEIPNHYIHILRSGKGRTQIGEKQSFIIEPCSIIGIETFSNSTESENDIYEKENMKIAPRQDKNKTPWNISVYEDRPWVMKKPPKGSILDRATENGKKIGDGWEIIRYMDPDPARGVVKMTDEKKKELRENAKERSKFISEICESYRPQWFEWRHGGNNSDDRDL